MELKLMFGDYEITITEQGDELSISAQRDGEVEEEFTLSKEGESAGKNDSEMKGFDEFEDEEAGDDSDEGDWDEDDEEWEGDEESEDDQDDDEEDEEDEDEEDDDQEDEDEEDDDKMITPSSGSKMVQGPKMGEPKLESFSSFLTRNKRK